MSFLDYIFLPVIFFLGVITSYQDFYYGKIKNRWIVLGLLWGAVIYIFLGFWTLVAPFFSKFFSYHLTYILPFYFLNVAINSIISLLAGYLLWYFKLWSAGDAKLFAVFAFLLPLQYYQRSAFPYFFSIVLLFNVFILAFSYLAFKSLIVSLNYIRKNNFWVQKKEIILTGWKRLKADYVILIKTIFLFFTVLFIFQALRVEVIKRVNIDTSRLSGWYVLIFLFVSGAFSYIRKLSKKLNWILIIFYAGGIPYLFFSGFFSSAEKMVRFGSVLKNSLFFSVFFSVFLYLFSYVQKKEQIDSMPFAVWLFLGVITTIILKGSLISFLLNPHIFWR